MKKWIVIVIILLLLPANIWLVNFYAGTKLLIFQRLFPALGFDDVFQSLNPEFAIAGSAKDPLNDFWCMQKKNAVSLSVDDGKILSVNALAEKDDFSWYNNPQRFLFSCNRTLVSDFNRDLIADYCSRPGDREENKERAFERRARVSMKRKRVAGNFRPFESSGARKERVSFYGLFSVAL